ncbi:MAG: peptidylprolyl isomerase [Polyangiaceae bacterium]
MTSKDARPPRKSGKEGQAPPPTGPGPSAPIAPQGGRARFVAALIAIGLVAALVWAQTPGAPAVPPVTPTAPPASAANDEPPADAGKTEPRAVGAAHVLVTWKGAERAAAKVTRSKDEARKRADKAMAEISRGEVDFPTAVQRYSDEESTLPSHGDIGNFERLVMPPAFSDAAFALEPGQLSDKVVETPLGFHIIKRTR